VKTAAVIAHYSADSIFTESFEIVVDVLLQHCELILIVTTSPKMPDSKWDESHVKVMHRPNVGYDFFSYKVGLLAIQKYRPESVIVTNSSYFVSSQIRFGDIVKQALQGTQSHDVVGLTLSTQHAAHIQSYFFVFSFKTLFSPWFNSWIEDIWPVDSKLELIAKYELRFLAYAKKNGASIRILYKPNVLKNLAARMQHISARTQEGLLYGFKSVIRLGAFNPTLAQAIDLSKQLGIIKVECVQRNPDCINLKQLFSTCHPGELQVISSFQQTHGFKSLPVSSRKLSELKVNSLIELRPQAECADTAVVLHLFYPELTSELMLALRNIPVSFDLFITTPKESAIRTAIDSSFLIANRVTICLVDNFGRDVAPFFALLKTGKLDQYSAVLKIHSKQSKYSDRGDEWRNRLLTQLLPSPHKVAEVISAIRQGAAIVGPRADYLTNEQFWGANRDRVISILSQCGFNGLQTKLGFFAGTMFWYSPKLVNPIADRLLKLDIEFETEQGQQDGTLAHALERGISELARQAGHPIVTCNPCDRVLLQPADEISSSESRIPVLKHR
jgi:lipopolysaccharide biosynthesis protein